MATTNSSASYRKDLILLDEFFLSNNLYKWFTIYNTRRNLPRKLWSCRAVRETRPIGNYPCRVFLIKFEPSKRICVWLNEQEAEVDECSDYMYENYRSDRMKLCWVCKWIEWNENWFVDPDEKIDEMTIDKPDFYRLHGDQRTIFGDGGDTFLVYPVWIHENLPVENQCRERLLNVLYKLNEERQDFHPSPSPVEDIIDPDLLPYRPRSIFDRNRWIERRKRQLMSLNYERTQFEEDLENGAYNDLSEHEKLRDTYQWIPSEFVIDQNGKVNIQTPIIHLSALPEYQQSYDDIARIFQSMLPMFEQMKLIKLNCNYEQNLQVIIKAQSYNLKAGMKYSGRWHTEGQTENIVAVGVYYLDIDDQLEGGSLKFRPKSAPQQMYENIQTEYYVSSVKTGTAVVFSNSIPHRFQQIRNLTREDGRRRTFINFFIIDPEQRIDIKSSEIVCAPKNYIIHILSLWNQSGLPEIVIEYILKMLNHSSLWESEDCAKEFRASVRRTMLDEKTGWGWIFWGNCGITEFVRSLTALPPNERREIYDRLHHTESD